MIKNINETELRELLEKKDNYNVFIQQNDCQTCHDVITNFEKYDTTDNVLYVYTLNLQKIDDTIKTFLKTLSVLRTPIVVNLKQDTTECMVLERAEELKKFLETT